MAGTNGGFDSMDSDKQREIASKGGRASGGKNLENVDRSKAGKMGTKAQPSEAKRKGGQNSHSGR